MPDLSGWQDRNPVIIDDIIASGQTLIQAAASLRGAGLPPPVCIGVHALFAQDAHKKLRASGVARVVTCDTVPHPSNAIALVPPIVAALPELLTAIPT